MPSRRQVLATLAAAGLGSLAGCSDSATGGSGTTDCHTHALEHGDGDVLDAGAVASVTDGDVRLGVPLSIEAVRTQEIARLVVRDSDGQLAYVIPVSAEDRVVMATKEGVNEGQLYYEQSLGRRPQHGQYSITAETGAGESVDSLIVEFNCFTDVDD